MSNEFITDLLAKRRDRAIAIILGIKDREVDPHLPADTRARLRKVIMDQLNEFCEMASDITRSLDSGEVVLNQLYLEKLDEVHAGVRSLLSNGHR